MIATRYDTRTTTGNFVLSTLCGWAARETAGAAARFTIRGGGSGGAVLLSVPMSANQGVGDQYANPVASTDGDAVSTSPFHLTVDSGAVSVTVWGN